MLTSLFTLPGWPAAILIAVVATCACAAILWTLLRTRLAWRLATDIPNDRSLHTRPTPRIGGWGIVPVTVVATLLVAPHLWVAASCAALLAAVSQIDDRRGLPARVRFAVHFAAVAIFVWSHPAPVLLWLLAGMALLLLWLVNLYNFMDGADGLAGGMTLFGFAGYAVGAGVTVHPSQELMMASAAVAGAAAGFLFFNFHPAKIFLGDAGSVPLGFLAGAFGYWGWSDGVWPIWFPPLVFSPFIGDASVTLLRRLLRGEKVWQAHRQHYYQRMVQYGLGHFKTALWWYAVMATGIVFAVILLGRPSTLQWCSVGAWVIVLVLIGIGVDSRWRRFRVADSEQPDV